MMIRLKICRWCSYGCNCILHVFIKCLVMDEVYFLSFSVFTFFLFFLLVVNRHSSIPISMSTMPKGFFSSSLFYYLGRRTPVWVRECVLELHEIEILPFSLPFPQLLAFFFSLCFCVFRLYFLFSVSISLLFFLFLFFFLQFL